MSAIQSMSESEAEIMRLFWDAETPMTSARVIALLEGRGWKPSTIWTFLGRLVEKGLLRAEKKGKTNTYSPALSEQEYRKAQTMRFLENVHGGSIKSFFAALSGGSALTAAELEELKSWLLEQPGDGL